MDKMPDTTNVEELIEWCANYKWTMSAGRTISMRSMRWSHLKNIFKYLDAHPSVSKNIREKFTKVKPIILVEMMRRTAEKKDPYDD